MFGSHVGTLGFINVSKFKWFIPGALFQHFIKNVATFVSTNKIVRTNPNFATTNAEVSIFASGASNSIDLKVILVKVLFTSRTFDRIFHNPISAQACLKFYDLLLSENPYFPAQGIVPLTRTSLSIWFVRGTNNSVHVLLNQTANKLSHTVPSNNVAAWHSVGFILKSYLVLLIRDNQARNFIQVAFRLNNFYFRAL